MIRDRKTTRFLATLCVLAGVFLIGIGRAKADFVFGELVNLKSVVPELDATTDTIDCFSYDGLEMYIESYRAGGQGDCDLWVLRRTSKDGDWGPPENLGPLVKSPETDASACISADGLTLYFNSNRPGVYGLFDIYMTTRATKSDPWGQAVNMGPKINSPNYDVCPWISPDGLEFYIHFEQLGDNGNADIYVARRATQNDPWGEPVSLGPVVNSAWCEGYESLSPDGLLLLFTDNMPSGTQRPGGYGGMDVWMTRRTTVSAPWQSPVNLGPKINSSFHDAWPHLSPDGRTLYLQSNRSGWEIYQAPIIPTVDFNGDGKVDEKDVLVMREHWGQDYPLCDIGPMPWGDGIVDSQDLNVLVQHAVYPIPHALDMPHDVILSWVSVGPAQTQDVYLGPSFEDVDRADRDQPLGVLVSQGQTATTYDPKGRLAFGQTYYWRVDEVNAPPDSTISKGDVRSFTVEPYGYPVKPVKATGSSSFTATMGPDRTIDGSGLDAMDQHSVSASQMWLSKKGVTPIWIQYQFDKVYKLYQVWVWNSNQAAETAAGLGAKDVMIETSLDGTTWTALAGVPEFAQATGEPNYVHNTTVDFGGVQAKDVKLTINSNWAGGTKQAGLSEVRFFYVPVKAFEPTPATGATGVALDAVLDWRSGREAVQHQVYLGTDPNALALVNTVTTCNLPLGPLALEYGRTYYWKVNEVNDAATPNTWEGEVWSFSTPAYTVVDDFEAYDNTCNRIFFAWVDGFGHSGSEDCGVAPSAGNATGSTVGNSRPPFAERTVVHGTGQSMPLVYDNTTGTASSEAVRTFDVAQDWTLGNAQMLVLYFRGDEANGVGQLYLKVNDSKVFYNGAASAMAKVRWVQWTIDLASIGTNLKAVKSLCIGVSGPVAGRLYIDDIQLYREAPEVPAPVDPGTAGLAAYYAFEGNTKDSSGHGYDGTVMGNETYRDALAGYGKAIWLDGSDDYVDLPIGTLVSTLTSTTVAAWVNSSNTGSGWERIFDFGTGTSDFICLTPRQGTTGSMLFELWTPTGVADLYAPGTLGTGWHHVAVVIDSATMNVALYLDCSVVASGSTKVLPKDLGDTTQNWLGRSQWVADGYYGGMLDEFRIYSRALSEGELRYLAGDR